MVGLLDVNVLVGLIVPEHEHHDQALNWYVTAAATHGWSTCAVTELGVIRVCAQLRGGSWPPQRTADQLLVLTADGRNHIFWPTRSRRQSCRKCGQRPQGSSSLTSIFSAWLADMAVA